MPEMTCFDQCPEIVPILLPDTAPPQPVVNGGGGGSGGLNFVTTSNSDDVVFSGLGTAANPLRATFVDGRMIEFEMAIGKLNGLTDGETFGLYTAAKAAELPAGLVGTRMHVEDQEDDILINLAHNNIVVGQISYVGGVMDSSNVPAITLAEGDRLEVSSALDSQFSVLSLTILGLRELEYVP